MEILTLMDKLIPSSNWNETEALTKAGAAPKIETILAGYYISYKIYLRTLKTNHRAIVTVEFIINHSLNSKILFFTFIQ